MTDGVDGAGSLGWADFRAQIGEARFNQVVEWVQNVFAEVAGELSWEQIAFLRDTIFDALDFEQPHTGSAAGTFGWTATAVAQAPPDKLTAAVQSTPPRIARDLEGWSRADTMAAITVFLTFIQTILAIHALLNPATPSQITQVFNIVTNVQAIIVPPPAPSSDDTN